MALLAVSDLHVRHADNQAYVDRIQPTADDDWLIVAGDVAERSDTVVRTLAALRRRFAALVWVPGNHELWSVRDDPLQLHGDARYRWLVRALRSEGVHTPEDPYPVWGPPERPVVIAPLFLLYDYSFLPPGTTDKESALAAAYRSGIVCTDEYLLRPDPYPSREAWCAARLEWTGARLDALDRSLPTVLVNHFPLVRAPTEVLRYPVFAQWCGTTATAGWPARYRAEAVVYGHLHIPRTIVQAGIPHHEVSIGYPREWRRWGGPRGLRQILPAA